jgi:hypothetical protein
MVLLTPLRAASFFVTEGASDRTSERSAAADVRFKRYLPDEKQQNHADRRLETRVSALADKSLAPCRVKTCS